ncbi:gluconokinase [Ramlibacter humi]|uniref:Gluconokinase n=1 Tax=Ramlibacter humi TaxID=2530451 RepID=A0A4Z0BJT7_9BURK|nr:gluconokinase [Ramlibacter humi]TFY99051.1 gluconokinase [Ramlibacter humi]
MTLHVVVMGVSGCGKSEIGERLAKSLGLPLVEGDSFHPPANIEKMSRGVPLDDDDRAGWLDTLGRELASRPQGAVLTCSALKKAYRDRLRAAAPGLRFVHLALTPAQAQARVAARRDHFYPPSLVDSQFAALQDPAGEPGVVVVDASRPIEDVVALAAAGLR